MQRRKLYEKKALIWFFVDKRSMCKNIQKHAKTRKIDAKTCDNTQKLQKRAGVRAKKLKNTL